jgi:hypothetical protein
MSDDTIKTNFKKFYSEPNLLDEIGLYGVETIETESGMSMGPRMLLGTSRESLTLFPSLFDAEGNFLGHSTPCVDMVSPEVNATPSTIASKIDNEENSNVSLAKIPGWNLIAHKENKSFKYFDGNFHTYDEGQLVKYWKSKCTNKPGGFSGTYTENIDTSGDFEPETFPTTSIFFELALHQDMCLFPDVPYYKYKTGSHLTGSQKRINFTIHGWHDPFWLPAVNEVVAFSYPDTDEDIYPANIKFIKATESLRDSIIVGRIKLARAFNLFADKFMTHVLYKGLSHTSLAEWKSIFREDLLGWVVYSTEDGWTPGDKNKIIENIFPMIYDDLVEVILKEHSATRPVLDFRLSGSSENGSGYIRQPSMPRYVGILGLTHYPDNEEPTYKQQSDEVYGETKNSKYFDDMSIYNYMREYVATNELLYKQGTSIPPMHQVPMRSFTNRIHFKFNRRKMGIKLPTTCAENESFPAAYGDWPPDHDSEEKVQSQWKTRKCKNDPDVVELQIRPNQVDDSLADMELYNQKLNPVLCGNYASLFYGFDSTSGSDGSVSFRTSPDSLDEDYNYITMYGNDNPNASACPLLRIGPNPDSYIPCKDQTRLRNSPANLVTRFLNALILPLNKKSKKYVGSLIWLCRDTGGKQDRPVTNAWIKFKNLLSL